MRASSFSSELSNCSIRRFLLADLLAYQLQLEPDGRHRITPGPEMLAAKIALLPAQASDCNCALTLQKSDHRRDWVLGRNRNTHVHVVRNEVSFQNLALLLPGQRVKDRAQLATGLSEDGLRRLLGTNTTWYLQSHFEWVRL